MSQYFSFYPWALKCLWFQLTRGRNYLEDKMQHIIFCFVDHFEPLWKKPDPATAMARVKKWADAYPLLAAKHRDADGRVPQHTFFYPLEEYRPELVEPLAQLCQKGYGEVEVHLHHDRDTPLGLKAKIEEGKKNLSSHGLLGRDKVTRDICYAFIHGNWALNNSRGDGRWCGVNNELQVLKETGCYADFTLPSAPSDTQTRKINSIYYATDVQGRPKSHDTGIDIRVGGKASGDLMIIQGPLALDFGRRKYGILPRLENCDINLNHPATAGRAELWIKTCVHIKGRPEWVFVKIHTHGAQERNWNVLLGQSCDEFFSCLEERYNDGKTYQLHYVTAREMYNIIKAAEAGLDGNPEEYRDLRIIPSWELEGR